MTTSAKRVLKNALDLAPNERADLAARLIASLDSEKEAGADEAWKAEIERRIDDLDSGRVKAITMAEFWRRIKVKTGVSSNSKSSSGSGKRGARRPSLVSRAQSGRRQAIRK